MESSGWFGVRCVFRVSSEASGRSIFEERVTIWPARDFDEAIGLAEVEAAEYAEAIDATYLGLAQTYMMVDEPRLGAEVFSLLRDSDLSSSAYLDAYFATGAERERTVQAD